MSDNKRIFIFWCAVLLSPLLMWGFYALGEPQTVWLVDLILNLFR